MENPDIKNATTYQEEEPNKLDYKEYSCHNDVISAFNNELYNDIFTEENIISKKKAIRLSGAGKDPYYGYFLEKGEEQYFMFSENLENLPFKVIKTKEVDYKTDVFKVIMECLPITIPTEEKLTFRQLINSIANFKHSNKKHFLLHKIISVAAWVDRVNFRISTNAGFGKDSVANVIANLVDSMSNLYGATFAKLEYVLMNTMIILNELGNLKKDEKINMQEFLLAVGAYFNIYTKRTRKTNTTQEQYDISKLSLVIFYNLPEYYRNKAQEYFDQMFTRAVIDRFIPFEFNGSLTTSFEKVIDIDKILDYNRENLRNMIATLNYFRQNNVTSITYKIDPSLSFPEHLNRYERSFNILLKYVSKYSESQEEFDDLSKELYKCYKNYGKLLIVEKEVGELK